MEELDLKELFELFWNRKGTILVLALLLGVVGACYSYLFVVPKYQASTTLVLTKAENNETQEKQEKGESITTTDITINSKLVSTYSELIKSKSVIREVLTNSGLQNLDENSIRKSVSVSSLKDTEVIEITVSNENPSYATKIANEIANVFIQKVSEIYNISNVHIVDEAEIPGAPYNINHKKDIAIFAIIGAVIGAGYVFIINMLDTTVKSTEDIEKNADATVLASISMYDYDEEKGGKRK